MKSDSREKLKSLVFTALMAAIISVVSPFSIPMPMGVPLSFASLAVYIAGALFGKWRGTAAVAVYLLIGMVGLPVFSGFTGGMGKLIGVTGGYLLGYLPCAFLTGLFAEKSGGKPLFTVLGMVLGTLSLYIIGTVWFMAFSGSDIGAALVGGVLPFIIGDAVKIIAACGIIAVLKKKLTLLFSRQN